MPKWRRRVSNNIRKIRGFDAKSARESIGDTFKIRYAMGFQRWEELVDSSRDHIEAESAAPAQPPRVRFKGIIESEGRSAAASEDFGLGLSNPNEARWNSMSRQIWLVARLTSIYIFFSILLGVPLGNYLAHLDVYGSGAGWKLEASYSAGFLVFAIVLPVLIWVMGYMLSRSMTMLNAAESIAAAAQRFVTPDITAAKNVDTVGAVVQGHLHDLNEGLDGALTRLATVEAMIRQHVEAIEVAGAAIEQKATGAITRVADERSRLMELTENLNTQADSFAAAIAEKAQSSIEALQSVDGISTRAESEFEERLARLESAAQNALASFESLRDALRETDESMRASAGSLNEAATQTEQATERMSSTAKTAAETAAREAASMSTSVEEATGAAIEKAKEETARLSDAAVEATKEQATKVVDASKEAVQAAEQEATKAKEAAERASQAAQQTGEAVAKASADIAAAAVSARMDADTALTHSKTHSEEIEKRTQALVEARSALEKENTRLEALIDEQRSRADRLADAISSQTERLSRLAEAQLSEQEAASRLTDAQTQIQAEADRQAARRKRLEARAAGKRTAAIKKKPEPTKVKPENKPAPADQPAAQKPLQLKAADTDPVPPPTLDLRKAREQRETQGDIPPIVATPAKGANGAQRLEELARDIAERRPRNAESQPLQPQRKEPPVTGGATSEKEKTRSKGDVSWREILDAADDAEPLELGAVSKENKENERITEDNAIKIISRLQLFTHDLETRLYGDPPPALRERFERGDRNVFANRLLRLNEADVKRRIRTESGRNKEFERGIHEYLQGFEKLLEDATTSETADEELEEYLSSPLGRVYLLIGATVGYFA